MDKDSNGSVNQKEFQEYEKSSPFQPNGTSILNAILEASDESELVTYDPSANNLSKEDIVIAVVGEYPYAEGYGDNPSIELNSYDKAVLERCYESGNQMIVIMLSGRPLIINDHVKKWNGFIAAWLPGMAGEGVSDVVFGDYSPTGKLSFSWPRDTGQLPLNEGELNYDPLFPFGHGLTY